MRAWLDFEGFVLGFLMFLTLPLCGFPYGMIWGILGQVVMVDSVIYGAVYVVWWVLKRKK